MNLQKCANEKILSYSDGSSQNFSVIISVIKRYVYMCVSSHIFSTYACSHPQKIQYSNSKIF